MWYRSVCPLGTKLLPNGELCSKTAGPVCCREGCIPLRSYVPQMLELSLWRRWRSVFRRTVANSESVARLLRAQGAPIDEVILPGVPQRDERPPLSNPPTAAFVGRFVREKGVDVLLRAFTQVIAEVPDARLDLVGDGPERARLEKLAE
jgi:glycosyltransferase involved in cell wall biosynthesis